MASSAGSRSPDYWRQRRMWTLWRELLPGIEEFLVQILPQEKLSPVAEQRRQYFVERLDILKLPPSLPPRAGKRLSMELLEESEETCGIPAELVPELSGLVPDTREVGSVPSEVEKDFAAEQRKISRKMLATLPTETEGDLQVIEESDSAKEVKVYDDIDHSVSTKADDDEDDDEDDINALYEIPVARQPPQQQQQQQHPSSLLPASEDNSLSQPADISSMATGGSIDDISDDVLDAAAPPWQPPPLPPRTKKRESESAESRVSNNSLEGGGGGGGGGGGRPPELPFRPPLPRRNNETAMGGAGPGAYARSEKSDKSEKSEKSDMSDGDSTSYESFDENENETEQMTKQNVKLPKRPKKKKTKSGKLSKTRSSSTWEINVPFKRLDNVMLSGELQHKSTLSWNRRLVALSGGCMALYKPDKEARPVFVIPLSGFTATLGEPVGRKGFEMRMSQAGGGESYTFAADFKEWVLLWCEHINGISQGLPVPAYHQHLARTFSAGSDNPSFGSKTDLRLGEESEYEVYEDHTTDTISVFSSPPLTPQPPRFRPGSSLRSPASASRLMDRARTLLPRNRSSSTSLDTSARTASSLTLSRWDWKTLFYNWSFPLDQIIMGLRRGNLSNSNSNISISSDGVESDDSAKPRLRANKVMRMGSFAYRATQFFENLGKKSSSKRKTSSLSSATEGPDLNVRIGIQEESSLSSASIGMPVSPSSDAASPVFDESFRHSAAFSSPSSAELPPVPSSPLPPINNIKHEGYLNIFSSFNKRRWGQRWCLIRENMFECYRTQTSEMCELNFLLRKCVLRQALAETNSPLSLMLLENNREKITVEPPSKAELSQWLRVLMVETETEGVPAGLEDYFVEVDDNQVEDLTAAIEAEYTDIVGVSVMKSWEVGSGPILANQNSEEGNTAEDGKENEASGQTTTEDNTDTGDTTEDQVAAPVSDQYLYSAVIKRPSSSTLSQLGEDEMRKAQEEVRGQQEDSEDSDMPCFIDNLAVYNANKNTKDSGFYSVKEANSDSDSGSEVKTDEVSPVGESSTLVSPENASLPKCNTCEKEISEEVVASGGAQALEEDEEDESTLEKTMTSDDFKDNLESGRDHVQLASVEKHTSGGDQTVGGCENGVSEVSADAERDESVQNSTEDKETAVAVSVFTDNHVVPQSLNTQTANTEDTTQPCDKPKKKKKKGKNKKNKARPADQGPSSQQSNPSESTDTVSSTPKSPESKSVSTSPEVSGIQSSSNAHVEHRDSDGSEPVADQKCVAEDKPLGDEEGEAAHSSSSSQAGGKVPTPAHTSKFSQLMKQGKDSVEERNVYAQLEAVRSNVHEHEKFQVTSKGHSNQFEMDNHRKDSQTQENSKLSLDSVDSELLDSWGLTSILTRGLISDDSDFAEGGDECMSSPRGTSSEEVSMPLSGDLTSCRSQKMLSGSVGDGDGCSSLSDGSSQSDLRSSVLNEGQQVKGPEEDEVITELRERIGKLREKLVQIKRKRIAVRDKRVRAFSAEERTVCDKEYLVLESECRDTAAIIQNLEEQLKAASAACNKS